MLSQFYPPVMGGQERHVRDLAHVLVSRGHEVEVATIATAHDDGTTLDGPVPVHRLSTTAQRMPRLYADTDRPHALPLPDPELRAGVRLLQGGRFDVAHAHDWIVNSPSSARPGAPARPSCSPSTTTATSVPPSA